MMNLRYDLSDEDRLSLGRITPRGDPRRGGAGGGAWCLWRRSGALRLWGGREAAGRAGGAQAQVAPEARTPAPARAPRAAAGPGPSARPAGPGRLPGLSRSPAGAASAGGAIHGFVSQAPVVGPNRNLAPGIRQACARGGRAGRGRALPAEAAACPPSSPAPPSARPPRAPPSRARARLRRGGQKCRRCAAEHRGAGGSSARPPGPERARRAGPGRPPPQLPRVQAPAAPRPPSPGPAPGAAWRAGRAAGPACADRR